MSLVCEKKVVNLEMFVKLNCKSEIFTGIGIFMVNNGQHGQQITILRLLYLITLYYSLKTISQFKMEFQSFFLVASNTYINNIFLQTFRI